MLSKNDILISMKTKKGETQMDAQMVDDVKDTALKLDEIRAHCPEDYYYIKGWIHCLLQKEDKGNRQGQGSSCR